MKQYDVCTPVGDIRDKRTSTLIAHGSRVVILAIEGTKATVCRYGNYLESVITDLKFLHTGK